MASDTTETDTTTVDDSTAVISGFGSVVASLMASYTASKAGEAPKPAPWRVLGKIKIIYNAINALDISSTLELMELRADLAEVANLYLPADTRGVLASTDGSSDLALEIVARNLTQLPVLAKRLYQVRVRNVWRDRSSLQALDERVSPRQFFYVRYARSPGTQQSLHSRS